MNLYLKKRIFTDEEKSIFQLKSEWFSLYYAFKQKQNNNNKKKNMKEHKMLLMQIFTFVNGYKANLICGHYIIVTQKKQANI